jgi:hypothetical protein
MQAIQSGTFSSGKKTEDDEERIRHASADPEI